MTDHGIPVRQQADVGHAQDRATPILAAVILSHFLDVGNTFLYREARVFENDTALSVILAPDDRRYKKSPRVSRLSL